MLEKKEEERKENTMREGKFLQLEKERKREEEIVGRGRDLQERKKEENELFAECIFLSDSDEEEETVQEVKKVVEVVDLDDDEPIIIVQGKVVEEEEREIVEEKERKVAEEEDSQQDRQEEQYFSSSNDSSISNHDYNTNCNIIVGIGMLTPILEDEEDDYNSSSVTCEVSSNDDCKISSLFLCFQKLIGLHISISPFFHPLSLILSFLLFLLQ